MRHFDAGDRRIVTQDTANLRLHPHFATAIVDQFQSSFNSPVANLLGEEKHAKWDDSVLDIK